MDVRNADADELDRLATVWRDAWLDGHAAIVPEELTRLRTFESFRDRLRGALANVRVVGPSGSPLGFYMLKGHELFQLFVAAPARGTGVAKALIDDAEAYLAAGGAQVAWLACAIGNDRAARFYEKCGWRRAGTIVTMLDIPSGQYPFEVWRYEKALNTRLSRVSSS
jgi:GNAT superfamily N-acetyltransferase